MVTKRMTMIGLLVTLVAFSAPVSFAKLQRRVPVRRIQTKKEVKVYLYHDPGEYMDLSPVTRLVNANAPARAAIEALLKGPTALESRRGFDALGSANEFRIGSLTIANGTARINFVAKRSWRGFSGDIGPIRFKKAVELTLKQFPSIQQVTVSLNGDENFDN